jgi:hypothetical protein
VRQLSTRICVAVALLVDAYVHATDGYFYESNGAGLITQAHLFYAEAAVATLVALLILFRPTLTTWTVAWTVAVSALGAVVLYRYVDVGSIGPFPDLYEPTWDVPGKLLSAYTEGIAAALSMVGIITSVRARRGYRRGARLLGRRDPAYHAGTVTDGAVTRRI